LLRGIGIDLPAVDVAGRSIDLDDPSIGDAQIKLMTAFLLMKERLPSLSLSDTVAALLSPEGAVYYAAAYLKYFNEGVLRWYGHKDNPDALIAAYNMGELNYIGSAKVRGGCGHCNAVGQRQITNCGSTGTTR